MENITIVIPMFGYFLKSIRHLYIKATISTKNKFINMRSKQGIKIALSVLRKSKEGVKMNLINFQLPNKIYINDASEHGLGGFTTHGHAWVYVILVP